MAGTAGTWGKSLAGAGCIKDGVAERDIWAEPSRKEQLDFFSDTDERGWARRRDQHLQKVTEMGSAWCVWRNGEMLDALLRPCVWLEKELAPDRMVGARETGNPCHMEGTQPWPGSCPMELSAPVLNRLGSSPPPSAPEETQGSLWSNPSLFLALEKNQGREFLWELYIYWKCDSLLHSHLVISFLFLVFGSLTFILFCVDGKEEPYIFLLSNPSVCSFNALLENCCLF